MNRIQIIQRISPQLIDGHPRQIKGARPGNILVGNILVSGALLFKVEKRSMRSLEWKPRLTGGGVVADRSDGERFSFMPPDKQILENGNELVHCAIYEDFNSGTMLSVTPSQAFHLGELKEGKNYWLTPIELVTADIKHYMFKANDETFDFSKTVFDNGYERGREAGELSAMEFPRLY